MSTPELQNYIAQAKAAGMTEQQIKDELIKAGWQQTDINEAFGGATAPIADSPISNKMPIFKIGAISALAILLIAGSAGAFWYADKNLGWGIISPIKVAENIISSQTPIISTAPPIQTNLKINNENIYKSDEYNLRINYPYNWEVDEDEDGIFGGPGFRPTNLNRQDLMVGKFNKEKDCFFTFFFFSNSKNKNIPCKQNLIGEVTLAQNKFTKCANPTIKDGSIDEESIETLYWIRNPQTGNLYNFSFINNPVCQAILENSLKSLIFE